MRRPRRSSRAPRPSSPSTWQEGSYELYCPIGDHRDQGMEGELVVGVAGAGGGTGGRDEARTSEDEDDGSTTSGTGYR